MITLDAYEKINENIANKLFFKKFQNNIPKPILPLANIKSETGNGRMASKSETGNGHSAGKLQSPNFWLNNGNIDTGLHYDDNHGLLCLFSGKKVVTLFPPSDTKYLYPW